MSCSKTIWGTLRIPKKSPQPQAKPWNQHAPETTISWGCNKHPAAAASILDIHLLRAACPSGVFQAAPSAGGRCGTWREQTKPVGNRSLELRPSWVQSIFPATDETRAMITNTADLRESMHSRETRVRLWHVCRARSMLLHKSTAEQSRGTVTNTPVTKYNKAASP